MTGLYVDAFNAEMGVEKGWGYYEWGLNVPSISWVSQALLAGGTGTEYVRKIRFQGCAHYTDMTWFSGVPNPPATGWPSLVVGGDFDTSVEQFYVDMTTRMNTTAANFGGKVDAVRAALDAAGIGADYGMFLSYEGGLHFGPLVFAAGGATQRNQWASWYKNVKAHPDTRAFQEAHTVAYATASPHVKGLTEFNVAQRVILTGANPANYLSNFGIEDRTGEYSQRYLGMLDGIAAVDGA